MKKVITIMLASFFLFTIPVYGKESVVLLTEEWPPFNYTENNRTVGISTDLVIKALNKSKIDYTINIKPWKRVYNDALKNKNSLLFTTSRTPKRENLFKWIGPLYPRRVVLYRLKSNKHIAVNSIDDLKKYKIGVIRGGSVEEYLISKGFKNHDNYDSTAVGKQNILKLFLNRIDLIPGSELSMAHRMKETPYNFRDLELAFVLINQGGYYIAANKDTSDEIINQIQVALDLLIKEGERKKITEKYFHIN